MLRWAAQAAKSGQGEQQTPFGIGAGVDDALGNVQGDEDLAGLVGVRPGLDAVEGIAGDDLGTAGGRVRPSLLLSLKMIRRRPPGSLTRDAMGKRSFLEVGRPASGSSSPTSTSAAKGHFTFRGLLVVTCRPSNSARASR